MQLAMQKIDAGGNQRGMRNKRMIWSGLSITNQLKSVEKLACMCFKLFGTVHERHKALAIVATPINYAY